MLISVNKIIQFISFNKISGHNLFVKNKSIIIIIDLMNFQTGKIVLSPIVFFHRCKICIAHNPFALFPPIFNIGSR